VNDLFDLKTNSQTEEVSIDSTAAQAAVVKAPLAENNGNDFRRPAPQAAREKERDPIRRDETSVTDNRFLLEWDGAA